MDGQGASGYRLLLVQEDREIASVLHKYFSGRGMAVEMAHDVDGALAALARAAADVVLMDVQLPGGGLTLLQRIRGARSHTPVILVGGGLVSADEERAWLEEHRADAIFRKPLPLKDVVAQMDELVARSSGRKRQGSFFHTPPAAPSPPSVSGSFGRPITNSMARQATEPMTPSTFGQPLSNPVSRTLSGFGRPMSASGRTTPVSTLTGDASLPSLAAVAVEIFEQRLGGVLEVRDVAGVRRVHFSGGFIVDVTMPGAGPLAPKEGEDPLAAAEALDQEARSLSARALSGTLGTFALAPWEDNAVLASCVWVDPVDAVQRACLGLPDDAAAERYLAGMEGLTLQRGAFFSTRVALLSGSRPQHVLPAKLALPVSMREALTLARSTGPSGVRELLALLLSRALTLGSAPSTSRRTPPPHRDQLPFRAPGLPRAALTAREQVAAEWLRTFRKDAYETLRLPREMPDGAVTSAVQTARDSLGPPALEDVDLGGVRVLLELLRARRDEAARVLGSVTARFAYNAGLRARGTR